MKNWDYANHSHDVKMHGGVDNYVRDVKIGAVIEAAPILVAIGYGVKAGIDKIKSLRLKAKESEKRLREQLAKE